MRIPVHHHNLQESVALTLPTFIILVSLALVTDCYVVILIPCHPHPLTSSQHRLSVALLAPPFVAVQEHHHPGGAAVAGAIVVAIVGDRGRSWGSRRHR